MDRLRSIASSREKPNRADHTAGRFPCRAVILRKSLPARGTKRRVIENKRAKEGSLFPNSVIIFSAVM